MVAVVGAGPAGLMAAYAAASDGAGVILFDRNPEPGRKLLLTGGGRCNVTHEGEWSEMTAAFFGDGRFLYPAFRALSNRDTIAWFESRGVPLIREDTGKVFPRSDRASDVRDALLEACIEAGVEVRTGMRIRGIVPDGGRFRLQAGDRNGWEADAVVLATGGLSYPATGSDGRKKYRQMGAGTGRGFCRSGAGCAHPENGGRQGRAGRTCGGSVVVYASRCVRSGRLAVVPQPSGIMVRRGSVCYTG
jgi:predicted Rossmann fold flavoprotein